MPDIEEVFYENPKVQEATAIGIPHPTRGKSIKIFVVIKQGETSRIIGGFPYKNKASALWTYFPEYENILLYSTSALHQRIY